VADIVYFGKPETKKVISPTRLKIEGAKSENIGFSEAEKVIMPWFAM